jgi:long-chain fatty acid transport protein
MNNHKRLLALAVSAALAAPMAANATNGMNMEGYGPIATGMGGASMAYDNGTAAMMNNPATLGLMDDGSRFDVAVGILGPNVKSENTLGSESSSSTSFLMPAMGYAKKNGKMAYGVGMFAQGGMGAKYDAGSAVDQSANGFSFDGTGIAVADTSGHEQKSELGVGRIVFPLSYQVNDQLNVGASIDYVWGGLDIMWSMDAANFFGGLDNSIYDLTAYTGALQPNNRSVISGTLVDNFLAAFAQPNGFGAFHWGHFEFSDSSSFTQATKGAGFAGKLGFTYQPSNKLSIGGTFHPKTAMSDFKGDITMSFNVEGLDGAGNPAGNMTIPVTGTVNVVDFQWPATMALGMSYQATDKLMVAADVKSIKWSEVMKEFHMSMKMDATQASPMALGFAGTTMDFRYKQDWSDQTVMNLGVAYAATDAMTVRAGINRSTDPTNSKYVSFLFPATIETHYTLGMGYNINRNSSIDVSLTHAPEVKTTETNPEILNPAWGGAEAYPSNTITHSQTSYQLMYSHKF